MSRNAHSRRAFLARSAAAAGALLLGGSWRVVVEGAQRRTTALNAWVRIATDDTVTVIVSQAEMGQGISTTLPAVLVEELGADWSRVKFENAPTGTAYRNPRVNWQFTGNSESVTGFFDLMREMGAGAREMLIAAAAERWRVSPSECIADQGRVVHQSTGRRVRFGDVAELAATKRPPATLRLKDRREWRLIGHSPLRVDLPAKIDGSARFGIDVVIPNMVFAAVKHAPVFGEQVANVDDKAVRARPGVIDVVRLPGAVAVVATTYWRAQQACDRLEVRLEPGANRTMNSESLAAQYRRALDADEWHTVESRGTTRAAGGLNVVSEVYESQFLAHATMEPMNCTASVTPEGCEIWAPTQGQELTTVTLAQVLRLPPDRIRINRTYLGGGFGRRLYADFAVQAALLSKAVGRPVKLIWSREEDMQHDIYRPAVLHRLTAQVDARGFVAALEHQLVSPSILQYVFPPAVTDVYDPSCCEGLIETRYRIPNWRTDFKLLRIGVPTSVLRTTGYGPNIFALECFIDELAERAGRDPLEYRRALLADDERALAVLNSAAVNAQWTELPGAGRVRGLAFCEAFRTLVAMIVEVSVQESVVTVHRVVTAVDCGDALDPDHVRNQIDGGIAWGLSAGFSSAITFAEGRTVQSNFHDFEILRLPQMPVTETYIIDSGARPLGGVGEVGPVAIVPAVVNAVSRAIGRRLRSVPLVRHGLTAGDVVRS
jgi:isoquinoline 1-oxidoreductase beta subunit